MKGEHIKFVLLSSVLLRAKCNAMLLEQHATVVHTCSAFLVLQLNMAGGASAEEAVLSGTERPNAARKRPTAVKRAVLRARAARAAAAAAADAEHKAAALAAARAAAADVQRQYEVGRLQGVLLSRC